MKIKVTNTRSYIIEWPPDPWDKKLFKAFTKKAKDAYWAQKRVKGWNGNTHFISQKQGVFATGLLPLVLDWAKKEDIEVEVIDTRKKLLIESPEAITTMRDYELRWYQKEAVEAAIKHERGILKVPTGAGKTLVSASILESLQVKSLFLCERVNLAIQTRDKFVKEYGIKKSDVGIVGNKFQETGRRITIATIQSAHKLEDLSKYQCLIIDELHHAKASSYIKVLKQMTGCYYRFGLSGTPFSDDPVDNMYRISQLGPIIYDLPTSKLIDEGILSKPTIRMIEITKPWAGYSRNYIDQYKLGIVQSHQRNNIIAKFANNFRGKTLILFKIIEHGHTLRDLIPKALYIDGDTPPMQRHKMLEAFNNMYEGILLSSTISDEGIDYSSIQHLIIAGGEKSIIKGIQRLGRGLRSDGSNQDTVNVIDFMDKTSRILERHSKKRIGLYRAEGHTVKLFNLGESK